MSNGRNYIRTSCTQPVTRPPADLYTVTFILPFKTPGSKSAGLINVTECAIKKSACLILPVNRL